MSMEYVKLRYRIFVKWRITALLPDSIGIAWGLPDT